MGHCVNASPANIVNPMLSLGLPDMKSAATSFAASMRLGFKSSASIDVDTSMASMMSMPSTVLLPHELCVWGRARTMTISVNVMQRSSIGRFMICSRQLFGALRYALVSLIRIVGSLFFLPRKYHNT